jgi:hypothetical protein
MNQAKLTLRYFATLALIFSCSPEIFRNRSKPSNGGEEVPGYLAETVEPETGAILEFGDFILRVPPQATENPVGVTLKRTRAGHAGAEAVLSAGADVILVNLVDQVTGLPLTASDLNAPLDMSQLIRGNVVVEKVNVPVVTNQSSVSFVQSRKVFLPNEQVVVRTTDLPENVTAIVSFQLSETDFALTVLVNPTEEPAEFEKYVIAENVPTTVGPRDANFSMVNGSGFASLNLGLASDGKRFIAADARNNRVLIWNDVATVYTSPADIVLGQENFTANQGTSANSILLIPGSSVGDFGVSAKTLLRPSDVCFDGTRLYVSDRAHNRVLVYNDIEQLSNNAPADLVLGQPDFSSVQSNRGGAVSAATLWNPGALECSSNKLIVCDYINHRVLIWNNPPTQNGQPADIVLGQASMSSNTYNPAVSARGLAFPSGVSYDGAKLAVSEVGSHRILIWNSMPTSDFQAADVVIGQSAMNSNVVNSGGLSARSLWQPQRPQLVDSKLIVVDRNNRALIWNTIPTSNFAAADVVIGQADGASSTARQTSSTSLNRASDVISAAGKIYVSDGGDNRVLVWNSIPTTTDQAADAVIGQKGFAANGANRGEVDASNMSDPTNVIATSDRLIVSDTSNHRVLIWKRLNPAAGTPADIILGQPDGSANFENQGSETASASSLNGPEGLFFDGKRLIVVDSRNQRVMIWNGMPESTNQPADLVLGQPDFNSVAPNNGGRGAAALYQPMNACVAGEKLVVSDCGNHRVLIWNTFPTSNMQPANVVLGQTAMNLGPINAGGAVSAKSMKYPVNIYCDENRLMVADQRNSRVLIWNSIPTSDNAAADVIIGQSNATTVQYALGANRLRVPAGIAVANDKLYVSDTEGNRVLVWNSIPSTDGVAADAVIGQPNFDSGGSNVGGISNKTLFYPRGIAIIDGRLHIADSNNDRIVRLPISN